MSDKKPYVLIDLVASDTKEKVSVNGFDTYLTDWQSWDGMVGAMLEAIGHGESVTVKLTLLEMTDAEHAQYVRDNEIDMGD